MPSTSTLLQPVLPVLRLVPKFQLEAELPMALARRLLSWPERVVERRLLTAVPVWFWSVVP